MNLAGGARPRASGILFPNQPATHGALMKIKELLRAHELASVKAHNADTVKRRETEFDLISVIAKKLRSLRKSAEPSSDPDQASDAAKEAGKQL